MYNVLLADDEYYVRAMLRTMISWEEYGFSIVSEAENGEEALQQVAREAPHLLIADIEMPFVNGVELAQSLCKAYPDLLLVFLTGYDRFEYARAAIRCGVYEYLLKPVGVEELTTMLQSVKRLLDGRKRSHKSAVSNVSAYALLRDELIEKLRRHKYDEIISFLQSTIDSIGREDFWGSGDAIKSILFDTLSQYCEEMHLPCELPEEISDGETVQIFLKICFQRGEDRDAHQDFIAAAQQFIERHYMDPKLCLAEIAKGIFINPSYLSRIYNQTTGQSISTYIRDVRLKAALKMLEQGASSVEMVAYRAGYHNTGYFSKCFKEKYGLPPSEFVKERS